MAPAAQKIRIGTRELVDKELRELLRLCCECSFRARWTGLMDAELYSGVGQDADLHVRPDELVRALAASEYCEAVAPMTQRVGRGRR